MIGAGARTESIEGCGAGVSRVGDLLAVVVDLMVVRGDCERSRAGDLAASRTGLLALALQLPESPSTIMDRSLCVAGALLDAALEVAVCDPADERWTCEIPATVTEGGDCGRDLFEAGDLASGLVT